MSTVLSHRTTQLHDLPLPADAVLLHPEQVILRFGHGRTIDVGSLCYLKRDFSHSAGSSRHFLSGRRVQLDSVCVERICCVRKLINQISEEVSFSGYRDETLRDNYSRFIAFMSWADKHGWHRILENKDDVSTTLSAYVGYLRERVRRMEFTLNSAARQQAPTLAFELPVGFMPTFKRFLGARNVLVEIVDMHNYSDYRNWTNARRLLFEDDESSSDD